MTRLPGLLPWWRKQPDRPLEPVGASAWIDDRGVSTGKMRRRLGVEEFLEGACRLMGVSPFRVLGPASDRATSRLRYLIAGVGIERWGQRPSEIAAVLGRWPETVGRWARRAGQLRQSEPSFIEEFEQLDTLLSEDVEDIVDKDRG